MAEQTSAAVDDIVGAAGGPEAAEDFDGEESLPPLELDVNIQEFGPCERHIRVSVARKEVDGAFQREFSDLMKKADVPGFRRGKTPRRLIEKRFRSDLSDQIKLQLVTRSLEQIEKVHKLSVISEPNLNFETMTLPDEGDFVFEFNVEVRPEFDLPDYTGLAIRKPVRRISDDEVDREYHAFMRRNGALYPRGDNEPAERGDYVVATIEVLLGGSAVINVHGNETLRIEDTFCFRDAVVDGFADAMVGVKAGDAREVKLQLNESIEDEQLRNANLVARFNVKGVKRLATPENPEAFVGQFGFTSVEELRQNLRRALERRVESEQKRLASEQVVKALSERVQLDLPPSLLRRQGRLLMDTHVRELRAAGFSDDEIHARSAEISRSVLTQAELSLRQQFIFQKIAELVGIKLEESDFEDELEIIAEQSGDSVRRVRARIEKDNLRNWVEDRALDRKVIEHVLTSATIEEVPAAESVATSAYRLDVSALPERLPTLAPAVE